MHLGLHLIAEATQAALLSGGDQEQIAKVLGGATQREVLLKCHAAYLDFYGDWLDVPQTLPWWQRSITVGETRVHVAGLDSAWMAKGGRQDYGCLLLGLFQINQTVDVREAEGADWRLALLHHPWDHIAPFDLDDTAHIDIRGLVTGRPDAHRFPIEELYIELRSTGTLSGSADTAGQRGGPTAGPDARPDTPLRQSLVNRSLVIIGDPGCGKTTFLRWVAHCLAADRLGRDPGGAARHLGLAPGPSGTRLPLLVSIADWLAFIEEAKARNTGPALAKGADWLPAYLGARAQDADQGLTADEFRRWLRGGEALILLDGLDEAPDRLQRRRALDLIERLAQTWKGCPLAVTSRPAAYRDDLILGGFAHTHVEALDAAAIDGFLARWSRALFPERPDKAEAHRKELAAAPASRREIRLLARNTVMLTALAVVHWNDKRLPEQRAELYASILRWLLAAREQRPGREKPQRCRELLATLALAMQSDPQGRQVQVTRRWAAERIAGRFGDPLDTDAIERADAFLAEEEIDSGILVRRGHQLKFWHLTFQEYLAAQALAGRRAADRTALLLGKDPALYRPEWRETVLLLAGVLYLQGADKVDALVGAVLDRLGETPSRAAQAHAAGLLGALVRDLAPFAYRPSDPRYQQVLDAAQAVFDPQQAPGIPLQDRIAAADALAQVGDPRLEWTRRDRWVELTGGSLLMGAQSKDKRAPGYDPDASDRESPVHPVTLGAFRIAAFPVTVAEYGQFLDDEDHRDPGWWVAGGGDQAAEPDDWEGQQAHPSRPVVGVSWHQAMAFCGWLTDRLGRPRGAKGAIWLPPGLAIRLPTEAEWEYAAAGRPHGATPGAMSRPTASERIGTRPKSAPQLRSVSSPGTAPPKGFWTWPVMCSNGAWIPTPRTITPTVSARDG